MYTALKARIPFLDINQERDFGYEGYDGMLELAKQLCLTIESPVWEAVRSPAPWSSGSAAGTEPGPLPEGDGVKGRPVLGASVPTRMPKIIKRRKALSVNPLKASSTVGAALAFLGFRRSIPMLHGSQGCTAFGKVFFVRHFREPIPLQSSAMDQVSSVMGADDNVVEGLKTICEKNSPDLVGVPTTGLAETQGADIRMAVRMFRDKYPRFDGIAVVPVSTPDFTGSMESGYALAVKAIIEDLVPAAETVGSVPGRRRRQINVLAGISARPVPAKLECQRAQLQDAMLDSHFMLALSRFALAADADLLVGFSELLASMGAETVVAVAPSNCRGLMRVRAKEVQIGDLEDLESAARAQGTEVLIGNSHAAHTAERLGVPLMRTGFPLYDQVGGYQRTWIGYVGGRQTLFDLANILLCLEKGEIHPYWSRLSQKPAEESDPWQGEPVRAVAGVR